MIIRKAAIAVTVLVASVLACPAQTIWDSLAIDRDSLHDVQIDELQREQIRLKRDLDKTRSAYEQRSDSLFFLNEKLDAELDVLRKEKEKLSEELSLMHQDLKDSRDETEAYRLKLHKFLRISGMFIVFLLLFLLTLLFFLSRRTGKTSKEEIVALGFQMKHDLTLAKDEIREERKRDMEILGQQIVKKAKKQIRKKKKAEYQRIRTRVSKDMKSAMQKRIEKLLKLKKARKKK